MSLFTILDRGLTREYSLAGIVYNLFGSTANIASGSELYKIVCYIQETPLPFSTVFFPIPVHKLLAKLAITEEDCNDGYDDFITLYASFHVRIKGSEPAFTKNEVQRFIDAVVSNDEDIDVPINTSHLEMAVMETLVNAGFDGRGAKSIQRKVDHRKAWQQAHEFVQQLIIDGGIQDFTQSTFQSGYTRHRAICTVVVDGTKMPLITPWCITANTAKVVIARLLYKVYLSTFEHKVVRNVVRVTSYLVRNDLRHLQQLLRDAKYILENYFYNYSEQAFMNKERKIIHELKSPYGAAQVAFALIHAGNRYDISDQLAKIRLSDIPVITDPFYKVYSQLKVTSVVEAISSFINLLREQRDWRYERGLEHFNKAPCLGYLAKGREGQFSGQTQAHVTTRATEALRTRLVDISKNFSFGRNFLIIDWAGKIEVAPIMAIVVLLGYECAIDVGLVKSGNEGRYMVLSRFFSEKTSPVMELISYKVGSVSAERYNRLYEQLELAKYDYVHLLSGGIGSLKISKIDTMTRAVSFVDSMPKFITYFSQDFILPDGCKTNCGDCTSCKEILYAGAIARRWIRNGLHIVKPRHAYGHNGHFSIENFSSVTLQDTLNSAAIISTLRNQMAGSDWQGKNYSDDFRNLMERMRRSTYIRLCDGGRPPGCIVIREGILVEGDYDEIEL